MLAVKETAINLTTATATVALRQASTEPGAIDLDTPFGSFTGSFTVENRTFSLLLATPAGTIDGSLATSIENRLFIDFKTFAGEFRGFGFYDEDSLLLALLTPIGPIVGAFTLDERSLTLDLSTPAGPVKGAIETTVEDRLFIDFTTPLGDVEGFGFYDEDELLLALFTPLGSIVGDFELADDLLQFTLATATETTKGAIALNDNSLGIDITSPLGDFTGRIGLGGLPLAVWMVPLTLVSGILNLSSEMPPNPVNGVGLLSAGITHGCMSRLPSL
ncbi:MAG TPA: hypothetical protein IGS37_04220 [Synechococcales cyanobacterium M55_K2018_004]|nr:hypothetical protein [Synechococcales cyanobacterium M55_K2018_004]